MTAAALATATLAACSGGTPRATPTDTTAPGSAASSVATALAAGPDSSSNSSPGAASPSASPAAGPEQEAEGYRRRLVHDRPAPAPSPGGDVLRVERSGIVVGPDAGGRGVTMRDVDDAGMPGSAFAMDVSCVGRGRVDVAVAVEHENPMQTTLDCGATNGEAAYTFWYDQDGRVGAYSVTVTPRAKTVAGVLYRVVDPRGSLTATPTR
ncbi:hypothetical protein MOPEL_020_00440 [Mobilicoccus pelagius NBRC 104925]|uniref:Uncharacterized protein n=1 Tax=Mobilicoccus pelagius NBRC 104925 TaxID=1089455 RepID=H5UPA0_9MICO|nr:hypothetical protein MOPEL_020_00440 [Mobilicoccus pelagius NBRC 104925]